jgi:hypothetical protein
MLHHSSVPSFPQMRSEAEPNCFDSFGTEGAWEPSNCAPFRAASIVVSELFIHNLLVEIVGWGTIAYDPVADDENGDIRC